MDFKPTVLKIIISLILGILLGYLVFGLILNVYPNSIDRNVIKIYPNFSSLWIFYIITMIIVYIVYSLIQKRK